MSWDAIFAKTSDTNFAKPSENADGLPMGKPGDVRGKLDSAIPGIHWWNGTQGDVHVGSLSLEFVLDGTQKVTFPIASAAQIPPPPGEWDEVGGIGIHARGGGDPVPILVAIAKTNHWALGDGQEGTWIDLNSPSHGSWQEFAGYRDHVLDKPDKAPESNGFSSGVNLIISVVVFAALAFLVRKVTR